MRKGALCGWLALLVLVLGGCARMADAAPRCTVVIEEHAQVRLRSQVWDVERGSDLVLTLSVPEDMRVSDVIYDRYKLSPCLGVRNGYADYRLTLRCVRYPSLVRLTLAPLRQTVYHTQEGSVTVTEESVWPTAVVLPVSWKSSGLSRLIVSSVSGVRPVSRTLCPEKTLVEGSCPAGP